MLLSILVITPKNPDPTLISRGLEHIIHPGIAMMNRKGDKGSPCLSPLLEEKNHVDELLTRIENCTVLMQYLIHPIPTR